MVITLIGYRGSGKSTVAAPLAERLGWSWIDADTIIEQQAGKSIKDIFAAEGEPGFRRRERETLVMLLAKDDLVLAAGGGAILNSETRQDMRRAGPVVWLRGSVRTLADRIQADATTAARRPTLTSGGIREIEELLAIREPLYQECATLVVDTDGLSVPEIVEKIWGGLQTQPG